MKTGLIIGKFMPLHNGHIALIKFAKEKCDELYIVLCYTENDPIPGEMRKAWLNEVAGVHEGIILFPFEYDETKLPNTSVSSRSVSLLWAEALQQVLPKSPDIIFSSEPYGDYLAEYMNASHLMYDVARELVPVSATQVRENAFEYWDHIPEFVRPYFIKKVAILGSESTGKSTITEKLANHYNTTFVPEMARDIVEHSDTCTSMDLRLIATLHAKTILRKLPRANKLLFSDTDLNITRSYSKFLFRETLEVEQWIEDANRFDLYLFLETDCPYIQDGTRLIEFEREQLSTSHKQQLVDAGIDFVTIKGNWDSRFDAACNIINGKFAL